MAIELMSLPRERLPFLRQHWDGPIILKGIQHPDDARMAVRAGCDGIIVSNHGGRQLDGAVGSLEMLPSIVEAAGDSLTVLFDSGVRTGADILKALCLGAKGVLVGRPVMAGYAIAGKFFFSPLVDECGMKNQWICSHYA